MNYTEPREVTTKELDEAVKFYQTKRAEYEAAKAISNDRHAHMEAAERELIKLFQSAGKAKYECEGVGKVNLLEKLKVSTPKDLSSKTEFYGWLKAKYGEDYLAYLSINHNTLNTIYNESVANGEVPLGLELPTTVVELRFTKSK